MTVHATTVAFLGIEAVPVDVQAQFPSRHVEVNLKSPLHLQLSCRLGALEGELSADILKITLRKMTPIAPSSGSET